MSCKKLRYWFFHLHKLDIVFCLFWISWTVWEAVLQVLILLYQRQRKRQSWRSCVVSPSLMNTIKGNFLKFDTNIWPHGWPDEILVVKGHRSQDTNFRNNSEIHTLIITSCHTNVSWDKRHDILAFHIQKVKGQHVILIHLYNNISYYYIIHYYKS